MTDIYIKYTEKPMTGVTEWVASIRTNLGLHECLPALKKLAEAEGGDLVLVEREIN